MKLGQIFYLLVVFVVVSKVIFNLREKIQLEGLHDEASKNFEFIQQINSMPLYVQFVASLMNSITLLLSNQEERFNDELDKTKSYLKEKSMFKGKKSGK